MLSLIPAFYTREFKNLTAGGELALSLWARGEMRGSNLPAFEVKSEVRDGSFQYSSLPKAVTDINLAARIANPGGVMDRTEVGALRSSGSEWPGIRSRQPSMPRIWRATPMFRATAEGHVDLGAVKGGLSVGEGGRTGRQHYGGSESVGSDVRRRKEPLRESWSQGHVCPRRTGPDARQSPAGPDPPGCGDDHAGIDDLGEFGLTVGRSDLSANGQVERLPRLPAARRGAFRDAST